MTARAARAERLRAPLVTIGTLSAATLALHLRDPHQQGSWGFCPLAMMGVYCRGCGGLRAVNDLTDGNVGAAVSSNVLVAVGIPIAVAVLALWAVRAWRGTPMRPIPERAQHTLWWTAGVVALAFMVLRNTPTGAWLAP
ncbi:Protein of unknown function [Nocardioides terrae]|uniref:DUF2752 domain-containing protein n=1 Tax=Nocardioides terrae TaxID=574651 RepID=A0A1I1FWY3_9ACTN|nr:DUF2752 domain-containing protein [Nocardioides terrae]SFC03542.1 Protein of unknown function [Nocardioides terrae]